jgi:hypothetical protein
VCGCVGGWTKLESSRLVSGNVTGSGGGRDKVVGNQSVVGSGDSDVTIRPVLESTRAAVRKAAKRV